MKYLIFGTIIFVITGTMLSAQQTAKTLITGIATVIDGDTLKIGNKYIRIHGIDAPERKQACEIKDLNWMCGADATKLMQSLVKQAKVKCENVNQDRYGRIVGRCFSNGNDLGKTMVASGLALAYRRYSEEYVAVELIAKIAEKGVWSSKFILPWEWRQGRRLEPQQMIADNDCLIKGNISGSGEKIYHLPGGRYYAKTKINPDKSERYFCTQREAINAGWRKAR